MSETDAVETAVKTPAKRGNFFHIDRRTWAALCDIGDVKLAVSYLVIVQGTGRGGKLSKWSAKSIESHTGLHSSRAKEKINQLIECGFLHKTQESTRRSPHYEVLPFHEVEPFVRRRNETSLSDYDQWLLKALRSSGNKKVRSNQRQGYDSLVRMGLARCEGATYFPVTVLPDKPAAELIWLPNEIVQGTPKGEPQPLRLLRGRNDIWALRLFIELYDDHNLSAEGGISRFTLKQKFERKRLGQRGRHFIWGFTKESMWVRDTGAAKAHYARPQGDRQNRGAHFFESLEVLTSLGLVYSVGHLTENDDDTSEIIHAFGTNDNAEPMERELASAAQDAGEHMLGEELANVHSDKYIIPVFDSYADAQLVEVFRMRYRPKTSLTADWMRRLKADHRGWIPVYLKLIGRAEEAEAVLNRTA